MRKLIGAFLVLTLLFSLSGLIIKAESSTPTFDVSLTTMFDSENSNVGGVENTDLDYGAPVSFNDSNFGDSANHEFAFWVVNGKVREDLPIDHEFIITDDMNIQGVFSKTGEHAASFMDSNGELIDTQYVSDAGNANDPTENTGSPVTFSEDFSFVDSGDSSYNTSIQHTDENDFSWDLLGRPGGAEGFGLGNESDGSFIEVIAEGGVSSIEIKAVRLFTNTNTRSFQILINGNSHGEYNVDVNSNSPQTFSVDDIDESDVNNETIIRIESTSPGSRGAFDIQSLEWNTNPEGVTLPDKPKYVINDTNPWDKSLSDLTADTVYILQYEKDTNETFNLTVNDGTGSGSNPYDYNEVVTVTPDSAPSGDSFSHWEADGEIVSFDEDYAFTMLEDKTVDAVFQATPETEEPLITMSDDLELRTGYESYLSQFSVPSDYTLVDYGIIGHADDKPITLETADITKYTGDKYNGETDEYLMSIGTSFTTLRSYLVLENASGELESFYSTYNDTVSPSLEGISDESIELNSSFDPMSGVTATDNADGDITADVTWEVVGESTVTEPSDFETLSEGDYTIDYSVTDSSGNETTDSMTLEIYDPSSETFASDLFISEYIEGSSNNKAIEIYNGTGDTVDLSDYSVEIYYNGSSSAGTTLDLSGTLDHDDVYVIYNSQANQTIKDKGDESSGVASFNGDDALTLSKNDTVKDTFGVVGEDPGSSWGVGDDSTADHTLVRKSTVTGPSASWDPNEWDVDPQDTFDHLGSHTMD